jgi:hypothetical protein
MSDIQNTLTERGTRYGKFDGHANITQTLKLTMSSKHISPTTNWNSLSSSQREALEMIVHKIGRILNGDPDYDDSWIDIAGYAQLIVNELHEKEEVGVCDRNR